MESQDWADLMVWLSIWIVAIVALRPVVLWYFKIDEFLEHLRALRGEPERKPQRQDNTPTTRRIVT